MGCGQLSGGLGSRLQQQRSMPNDAVDSCDMALIAALEQERMHLREALAAIAAAARRPIPTAPGIRHGGVHVFRAAASAASAASAHTHHSAH
jgi:hypothetical protein